MTFTANPPFKELKNKKLTESTRFPLVWVAKQKTEERKDQTLLRR